MVRRPRQGDGSGDGRRRGRRHGRRARAAQHLDRGPPSWPPSANATRLLVIDNCEHLLDGVRDCVERILAACPNVTVLATSRSRLLVPYEWVYEVPGLSVTRRRRRRRRSVHGARRRRDGRASAPWTPDAWPPLCRALDGMALAIELAAARLLDARTGRARRQPSTNGSASSSAGTRDRRPAPLAARRHRLELRAARSPKTAFCCNDVAVLASWFDVDAARAVSGTGTPSVPTIADGLARLAGHSLLVVERGEPTRYRALETIRQYGVEQLAAAGELGAVRARHEHWCRAVMTALGAGRRPTTHGVRSSIGSSTTSAPRSLWSAGDEQRRSESASLGRRSRRAAVRPRPASGGAAALRAGRGRSTPIAAVRAAHLRLAAGAAASRYVGNEALRLLQCRRRPGTRRSATEPRLLHDLACRWRSTSSGPPGSWSTSRLSTRRPNWRDEAPGRCRTAPSVPRRRSPLRRRAAGRSGTRGSPRLVANTPSTSPIGRQTRSLESAALDQLCAVQLDRDDIPEAA